MNDINIERLDYTMKSVRIKEQFNAPYAVNPVLRKNPCYKTTHIDDYKNYTSTNKYANVKSKYRTNNGVVNNTRVMNNNP